MSRIAIVSAMHEELAALLPALERPRIERIAARDFHFGRLGEREVVLVLSGIGKVAAAATAAVLLDRCGCTGLLFTGVAGGLGAGIAVGDVVVADELLQHDLDASPLFPRWQVPGRGISRHATDDAWSVALAEAARAAGARVHRGLVVSGDRFVCTAAESAALRQALPDALAVEMEGAAMAQVAADFGVRCALLRTVSDRADDDAHADFGRFVAEVAARLTHDIVMRALPAL